MDQNTNKNGQKEKEAAELDLSKQETTKNDDNFYFSEAASLPEELTDWIDKNQNELVTVWNHFGKVCYVSGSAEHLLGYQISELKGTYWYEQISPEDSDYMRDCMNDLTQNGKTFNINIKDKHGKYVWSECHVAKIESEGTTYYVSTLRDISDKKEMEEMMIRSEQMSIAGQLAAGVAHEIRNPLTSLKGFIQLLQAGLNRKDEYYKIMIDEIEKMETITSELLFISKPTTDHKQKESVTGMLQDVTQLLEPQARKKNITFKWDPSCDFSVPCDRSQVKQVFINLLKNAVEAMEDGGLIQISMSASGDNVIIEVIDEGPGIPEEIIHKLGEPFFTTKQNGTGLGLMITKQILERHNGELQITKNKEKGSTFTIKLKG